MYISHVQHPVFRVFLKFLANCVFGRPSNHLTRLVDITVVAQACEPNSFRQASLPEAIIAHLLSVVSATTPIVCGGLITHIASQLPELGFQDSEFIDKAALISIPFLKHGHDILPYDRQDQRPRFQWVIKDFPGPCILPRPGINDHLLRQPHYCLPDTLPRTIFDYLQARERRMQRRRQGLPSEDERSNASADEGEIRAATAPEEAQTRGDEAPVEGGQRIPIMGDVGPSHSGFRGVSPVLHDSPHHSIPPADAPLPSQAYLDQRFDQLFQGQQQILERLDAMSLQFNDRFHSLNHRITGLEEDNNSLLRDTYWLKRDMDELFGRSFPPPHGDDNFDDGASYAGSPHPGPDDW